MTPVEKIKTAVSLFARDRKRATRMTAEVLSEDPAGPYAHQVMARSAESAGRIDLRDRHIWASAALAPAMIDILPLVGAAFESHDEIDKAIALYWRGLLLQPGDVTLRMRLGNALAKTEEKAAAAMVFRQVLLLDPGQRDADNLLAQMPNARLAIRAEGERKLAEASTEPLVPSTKPRDPNRIAVLCPTRGRPSGIRHLVRSIAETVRMPQHLDLWLYIDADDKVTLEAVEDGRFDEFGVSIIAEVGPRLPTLGAMYNRLWERAAVETGAGLAVIFVDDVWFSSKGWDDYLRLSYAGFPDRMLLTHLPDPAHRDEDVILFCVSAEWIETVGYVMSEWFPFWFTDMWNDQIAQMVQRKRVAEVTLDSDGKGKTYRLWDLDFWWRFFSATAGEREAAAERLRLRIFKDDPEGYFASRTLGQDFGRVFRGYADKLPKEMLDNMEQTFSGEEAQPGPGYDRVKAKAAARMEEIARDAQDK
ncbi:MAG: hypothetical protein NXI16_01600 [Alphaproteobacteria bacterium]|nr:hypothetical protein [Alphaproteobacteria bacterium]